MKEKNLVNINAWRAYKDDVSSQYILVDNNVVSEVEGQNSVNVGVKNIATSDDALPWVSVEVDLFLFSGWKNSFDISNGKTFTITYKTKGNNKLYMYLRTRGITESDNLPFFVLEPSKKWNTKILDFNDINPPSNSSSKGWGFNDIDGISFSFYFPNEIGEDHLYISHLSIDPYVAFEFNYSKSGIYRSTILTPIQYELRCLQEQVSKLIDFLVDWIKMNAPTFIKRKIWNKEFIDGNWDFLESGFNQYLVGILEKEFNGGTILDLGCGFGNYAKILKPLEFRKYLGIDISDSAIKKAILLNKQDNVFFISGAIENFKPDQKIDCILMNEVAYYFEGNALLKLLDRYLTFLNDNGFIILGIANKLDYEYLIKELYKFYPYLEICNIDTLENFDLEDKNGAILLLRKPL